MKVEKKETRNVLFCVLSLLFFVIFALAVFIAVWLIVPNKPSFFESIRIEGVDTERGGK